MLALAAWTIVLIAVLGVVGLATLLAVALGRASARADADEDRLIAERRQSARGVAPPPQRGRGDGENDEDVKALTNT